jgi:hypothetical protein
MALRNKIDSNETSLYYAEESDAIGVLPTTPDWYPLEPNDYKDFGGEITTLARNPINSGRQRKKAAVVDLDAGGGFEQDFTLDNTPRLMQGLMFATFREKRNQAVTSTSTDKYNVANEVGFLPSALILASGFATPALNGVKKIAGAGAGYVGVVGVTAHAETGKITTVGFEGDAGDFAITQSGGVTKLTSADVSFIDLGITAGEWIYIGGDTTITQFDTAGNNGFKRVRAVTAASLIIDQSDTVMAAEAGGTKTIRLFLGRVLKNEVGALIKRRTYQLERQLGAPDNASPSNLQAEYLTGQVASEFEFGVDMADKILGTWTFMGLDSENRPATTGIKAGNRIVVPESDMFNTSSDFASMRMSVVDPANNSPTALFAYVTDMKVNINNNVSINKAVGVLGGFDVTVGTFEVSIEATAYFQTVEAIAAVRANPDVQLYAAVCKDNAGFVMDLPLIALGDARNEVKQDEPIMLPLKADAATAAKLASDLNHTLLWVFFDYLPDAANP